MELKKIKFDTKEYHQSIDLRDKILRKPLGLTFSEDFLREERGQIHLGLFDKNEIVGILLLKLIENKRIKMRQVAIDDTRQRQGLGRILVDYSEVIAKENGAKIMELNAREISVPFYLSLGYKICSEKFFEVRIPHFKMEKNLF